MDTSQDSRQAYATPSFHELNKVQRQVFQPSTSVPHESSTSIATSHSQSNQGLVPTEDEGNTYQLRNALSAGTQARVTDKSQVFLPGNIFGLRRMIEVPFFFLLPLGWSGALGPGQVIVI